MAARLSAIIVVAIVGATIVAGLIVGAQRDGDGPVDLIVHNGRVYTGDPVAPFAGAVAIRGNQIVRVGSDREVKRLRRPQTAMLDAEGGAVVPSLNDARVNLVEGGLSLDDADLSGLSTVDDLQRALRAWAQARPEAAWVRGRAWTCDPLDARTPPRLILDAVDTTRPVYVSCADGVRGWASSSALDTAGIGRAAGRSRGTGPALADRHAANGIVSGSSRALVEKVVPEPGPNARLRAVGQATSHAHALGVTSVHDATPSVETLAVYDDLRRLGELRLRIYATLPVAPGASATDIEELDAVRARFGDDPLLKVGAVRLRVDEAIAPQELDRLVTLLDARGWQIIADAPDEVAVRRSVDAFARAAEVNPVPPQGRRHRIEGIDEIADADAERLSALGVVAVVGSARTGDPVDPDDTPSGPAWLTLQKARSRLVFASDWPAGPLDPREALSAAMREESTAAGDPEADDQDKAPRLTMESAMAACTAGVAYAAFDDHRKGQLARGMLADLVVLSTDVFATPPDRFSEAVVEVTVFDGRIVYRRDEAASTEH